MASEEAKKLLAENPEVALQVRYLGYPTLLMRVMDKLLNRQVVEPNITVENSNTLLIDLLAGEFRMEGRYEIPRAKPAPYSGFDFEVAELKISYKRYLDEPTIEFQWSIPGSDKEVSTRTRVDIMQNLIDQLLIHIHLDEAIAAVKG